MKKIGMVVALEKELTAFLKEQTVEIKEDKSGAFHVLEFKIGGCEVICVKSGVGEIFAAAATQYLISVYKPEAIINFGICGSLTKDLGVEKVALAVAEAHNIAAHFIRAVFDRQNSEFARKVYIRNDGTTYFFF